MKTITKISIIATAVLVWSCTKEPASEPNANFIILKQFVDGTREVDTITAGDFVTFKAVKPSEMTVFYNGLPVYKYSKRKEVGGQDVGQAANNGELTCRYINPGVDTVVCVSSSYGNWSKEELRSVVQKVLVVLPKQN